MSPALKLLPLFPTILRIGDEHGNLFEERDWRCWSWCNSEEIEACLINLKAEKSATQILYHFSVAKGGVFVRIPTILVKEKKGLRYISHPTRPEIKALQAQRAEERTKGRSVTEFLVPAPWVRKVLDALTRGGDHLAKSLEDRKVYVADERNNLLYRWE